ncbi:MAG: PA0069 family radical SAM protein [Gammaproteobacteria bacterium]|nr:PA0069 family radical SAM protein [Gammaproteobacteria bacterium]
MQTPYAPLKGRAALGNPAGRFERQVRERCDDGWTQPGDDAPRAVQEVLPEQARTIIARNSSPDVPFSQSVNPYRGCEHGCIYCYARPSHAYIDLSPGLDFERRLRFKANAAEVLERELCSPRYVCEPITLGANTDPYQPVEAGLGITRRLLEVCERHAQPVSIITKSALVLRDIDLLARMAARGLCHVMVSVTTLDDGLKRRLEPSTASGAARLRAVRALTETGVPVGVLVAPVIPMINDAELEAILAASADAGARKAAWILLRLPWEVRELFREWLQCHYPERAEHVMSLIRQSREGRENDPRFGSRMRGSGPYADLIARRFTVAARRCGLAGEGWPALDCTRFTGATRPARQLQLW